MSEYTLIQFIIGLSGVVLGLSIVFARRGL